MSTFTGKDYFEAITKIIAAFVYLAGPVILFAGFDWSYALVDKHPYLPFVIAPILSFFASGIWNGNFIEYGMKITVRVWDDDRMEFKTIKNPVWGMFIWATIVSEIISVLIVFAQ